MRILLALTLLSVTPAYAASSDCRNTAAALKTLASETDGEVRSTAGICLVKYQLDKRYVFVGGGGATS